MRDYNLTPRDCFGAILGLSILVCSAYKSRYNTKQELSFAAERTSVCFIEDKKIQMTDLTGFIPRKRPGQTALNGCYIDMEPLEWDLHGTELTQHVAGIDNANLWTFVPIGPFDDLAAMQAVMSYVGAQFEWEIMAVKSKSSGKVLGTASYMRIREMHGSAEVGCVVFGHALQKTRKATEVIYLMAKHVFENLGYRRFEWKYHNDNDASKQAALRFGFTFEGVFRNDTVSYTHLTLPTICSV